jgi:hypothetical protein
MRLLCTPGLLLLLACDQPAIELIVERPADLPADMSLQVAVYALSDAHSFDCDAIAYGDVPADALQATLVMSAPLSGNEGSLADVERIGDRLIVVRGYDGQGREAVRGCTAVGDVSGRQQITVALARTTSLNASLVEQLYVDTSVSSLAEPAIDTSMVDSTGVSTAGTLRVRVYGAAAALVSSVEQPFDPASSGAVRVSVETPGPFAVELRSKNAIAPQPVWLGGFVEPLNSVVENLQRGSSTTPLHILQPTATSVAFLSVGATELSFAYPDSAVPPGVDYQTVSLVLPARDFMGQVYLQAKQRIAALLWRRGETTSNQSLVVVDPDPADGGVSNLVGEREALVGVAAIPLGRCDLHADASPLLVVVRNNLLQWTVFVVDVDGTLGQLPAPAITTDLPLNSRCVSMGDAANPAWTRLLVEDTIVDGQNGVRLIDLGPGLDAGSTWDQLLAHRSQFIAGAVALATRDVAGGVVQPVLLFSRGIDAALFDATLLGATSAAILDVGNLLLALPQVPKKLSLGQVVSNGIDVVALLSSDMAGGAGPVETPARERLYVATGVGAGGPVVAGTMRLPECGTTLNCELRVLDLDGDGLQEIAVAPVWLGPNSSATDVPARIIHLGHR